MPAKNLPQFLAQLRAVLREHTVARPVAQHRAVCWLLFQSRTVVAVKQSESEHGNTKKEMHMQPFLLTVTQLRSRPLLSVPGRKKARREVSALTRIVETAEDKNDKLTFASVLSVFGLRGVVQRRTIVAASGGLRRKPRHQRKKMINVHFRKLHFKTMNRPVR